MNTAALFSSIVWHGNENVHAQNWSLLQVKAVSMASNVHDNSSRSMSICELNSPPMTNRTVDWAQIQSTSQSKKLYEICLMSNGIERIWECHLNGGGVDDSMASRCMDFLSRMHFNARFHRIKCICSICIERIVYLSQRRISTTKQRILLMVWFFVSFYCYCYFHA